MYVSVKSQICFCFYHFMYILFLSHSTLYRLKWQLIRALQMFVEHVVLKHEGMLPYLRRLQLVSSYSFFHAHIQLLLWEYSIYPCSIWNLMQTFWRPALWTEWRNTWTQWTVNWRKSSSMPAPQMYIMSSCCKAVEPCYIYSWIQQNWEWSRQLWDSFSVKTRTTPHKIAS